MKYNKQVNIFNTVAFKRISESFLMVLLFIHLFLHLIPIFILLACRKALEALYIGQAITPDPLPDANIAVRLKFFSFCKDMTKI